MFYFFNIFFLLIYALMYGAFRDGVRANHKISRKAKLKGAKNCLWFEGVRESKYLRASYYINKIFTVVYLFVATVVLFIGWFDFAKVIIVVLMGILGAFLIPMNFYAWIHCNKREYGKSFVLWIKRKNGSGFYHSAVIDVMWSITPVLIVLFEIFYLI